MAWRSMTVPNEAISETPGLHHKWSVPPAASGVRQFGPGGARPQPGGRGGVQHDIAPLFIAEMRIDKDGTPPRRPGAEQGHEHVGGIRLRYHNRARPAGGAFVDLGSLRASGGKEFIQIKRPL